MSTINQISKLSQYLHDESLSLAAYAGQCQQKVIPILQPSMGQINPFDRSKPIHQLLLLCAPELQMDHRVSVFFPHNELHRRLLLHAGLPAVLSVALLSQLPFHSQP